MWDLIVSVPDHCLSFYLRTSRKLKNMILSINFAILTLFIYFLSNFLIHFRVDRYENLFIFFLDDNKYCRVGTKNRVGRVSGNTGIFLGLNEIHAFKIFQYAFYIGVILRRKLSMGYLIGALRILRTHD